MKIIAKILIVMGSFFFQLTYAEIGCLDTSYHLAQPFDHKNYHFVSCNCPCSKKVIENRNQCIECKHFHLPNPWHTATFSTVKRNADRRIPIIPTKKMVKQRIDRLIDRSMAQYRQNYQK